ncbi:hypothetical protein NDU88_002056 [Pleurodeles waltl]|uniref:Uncharacterized protein n=1 Tax=Pleurodeles waltl TaxID=8319 RepID=A0AAV7W0S9_PLEWA|nr:hypothetical protein NDU88_002056 [Pleurodeles waltl]
MQHIIISVHCRNPPLLYSIQFQRLPRVQEDFYTGEGGRVCLRFPSLHILFSRPHVTLIDNFEQPPARLSTDLPILPANQLAQSPPLLARLGVPLQAVLVNLLSKSCGERDDWPVVYTQRQEPTLDWTTSNWPTRPCGRARASGSVKPRVNAASAGAELRRRDIDAAQPAPRPGGGLVTPRTPQSTGPLTRRAKEFNAPVAGVRSLSRWIFRIPDLLDPLQDLGCIESRRLATA